MVRRTMAVLGLLAFVIAILGGLARGNSVEFILSRALWAMGLFCLLGMVVGWSAERVVREHRSKQYQEVFGPAEADLSSEERGEAEENNSTPTRATPIQN